MRFLGVEFAPFNIPLDRRLQTLAVFLHVTSFITLPFLSIIIAIYVLIFESFLRWIILAYLIWIFFIDNKTSSKGGRRLNSFRNLRIWSYAIRYFPIDLVKSEELPPGRNYILGYHPHGIMSFGAIYNFLCEKSKFKELFPGIKPILLTLKALFYIPFYREYVMAMGGCDVSKESIRYLAKESGTSNAIIIVIGGAEEALNNHKSCCELSLKYRKGFVKLAIESGSNLVPCFGFNENEIFSQVENPQNSLLRKFQRVFKQLMTFSPPLFYGRGVFNYNFGFLPYRKPIVVVVGKPISVKQHDYPTNEMINEYHELYCENLMELFEDNKMKYGFDENYSLILN